MDAFLDLTMRQVSGLLKVINRSDVVDFYNSILSYRVAQAKEFPSLNEFLELSLNESPKEQNSFDEKADKVLEAHALKLLEERRKAHEQ